MAVEPWPRSVGTAGRSGWGKRGWARGAERMPTDSLLSSRVHGIGGVANDAECRKPCRREGGARPA
jgi:hypothetical protein